MVSNPFLLNKFFTLLLVCVLGFYKPDAAAVFTEINSPFKNPIIKIQQDQLGFIWIATAVSIQRFDGYQFEVLDLENIGDDALTKVTDFIITDNDLVYIATANKGLLEYAINTQAKPIKSPRINDTKIYKLLHDQKSLWVATDKALYQLENTQVRQFLYPDSKILVTNMIKNADNGLLLSAINSLYHFNFIDNSFQLIHYNQHNSSYIWSLAYSNQSGLLLSTEDGLYQGHSDLHSWKTIRPDLIQHQVRTLVTNDNQVWLGSVKNGLVSFNHHTHQNIANLQHFNTSNSRIKNNEINHLFLDRQGNLWVGFYNGQINLLGEQALAFGYNKGIEMDPSCTSSAKYIYHINEDQQHNIWLTTKDALIRLNAQEGRCDVINPWSINDFDQAAIPVTTFFPADGHAWAYFYRLGFIKFNNNALKPEVIEVHEVNRTDMVLYEFIKQKGNKFIFASSSGVMEYDTTERVFSSTNATEEQLNDTIINDVFPQPNNQYYLATTHGVAVYNFNQDLVSSLTSINQHLNHQDTNALYIDNQKNLWVGTNNSGLYKFDKNHELIKHYFQDQNIKIHQSISNIIADDNQHLWITTENGLIKLSTKSDQISAYTTANGLQSDHFNSGAAIKTQSGQIYLGGVNGYNAFFPSEVFDQPLPEIAISELKRFNQLILPNQDYQGFKISQSIAYLKKLAVSHQDYIISFSFTDLNYLNPETSQFAYKLSGFDPDWNYVLSNNRTATYTNLPRGEFRFLVKSTDLTGQWRKENKSIMLEVSPPPWLSWWALCSYVLLLVALVYLYVKLKTKSNQKIADMLRFEVKEKTLELNSQKQTVESLLAKKNELFSHVSHEFRTPLTLILGPIKELLNRQINEDDINSLNTVNRNANRLLSLVEQLLQIARVSDFKKVITKPQKTKSQVKSLVDSFQHLAQIKKIKLQLNVNQQTVIDVSEQFIDAVLGNLLSNAIKYTPIGGEVTVRAVECDGLFVLSVQDNGPGLSDEQKYDIFKRFKRLDVHQDIDGIGIGLAVVKEVVKVNRGLIEVESEFGVGSDFIVKVPLSETTEAEELFTVSTLVKQLQNEPNISSRPIPQAIDTSEDVTLNTVLVIEDNRDMREHILNIVNPHYNCFSAENGVKGLATAIEQIPDIIISDVMMPEMDGFKVARIIRADERTSHIPLMLLTALNDKTNRIKGWRENVDAYMTKPFDRDELLAQLENMLTIRDILKSKAAQSIKHGASKNITLAKIDRQFIEKLNEVIALNYQDPMLNRTKIASKMAVSERQLQRKVKALIDQNPIDMLREFRLNQAKIFLKDGYQVSQVADDCGFNSLSYFSQCFKAQFGMSPKKYQQAN